MIYKLLIKVCAWNVTGILDVYNVSIKTCVWYAWNVAGIQIVNKLSIKVCTWNVLQVLMMCSSCQSKYGWNIANKHGVYNLMS